MSGYYAIWLFVFFEGVLYETFRSKRIKAFLAVVFIFVLAFFLGYRDYAGGGDYAAYEKGYFLVLRGKSFLQTLKMSAGDIARFPPFFMVFMYVSQLVFKSFRTVNVIAVAALVTMDFYSFEKLKVNPVYAVLGKISLAGIGIYVLSKQAIVISLMLFASVFLFEGKKKFFYICMITALGFHITAVFGFVLPVIKNWKISKKNLGWWTAVTVILFVMGRYINNIALFIWSRSAGYGLETGKGRMMFLALMLLNSWFYLFMAGREKGRMRYYLNWAMLAAVIQMAATQGDIIRRIVLCFIPYCPLVWLYAIKNTRQTESRCIMKIGLNIALLGMYSYLCMNMPSYALAEVM